MFFHPAAMRRLGLAFAGLGVLLLASCDKIKARIDSVVTRARQARTPAEDKPLSEDEQKLNQMLEDPKLFEAAQPIPEAAPVMEINKSATVSILGYHDFRERGGTPMIIAGPKFRQQMQAIKDSKIPVIPLSDVLAWKQGKKNIPEEAICITMDDGWEGVYQYAYPVLKEFGFPFTIYLYKKYVNIGGRSMTWAQIKEMMEHGCEVGSHTVSHEALTKKGGKNDADYQLWLLSELKESKEFLESNLGIQVATVAYPYGNHNELIEGLAEQVGYEAGITVNGTKVSHDQPNMKLARYIVHGEEDSVFRNATNFRARGELSNAKALDLNAKTDQGTLLVQLSPEPNSTIVERRPLIEANLIGLGTIVPESIRVRVSGFGIVPAEFDPNTFKLRYEVPVKLRRDECTVSITFKRNKDQPEELITWKFKIDLAAAYLPEKKVAPDPVPTAVEVRKPTS
jgi:peptidoglycan/xylan/chitin deacetylase (PgdA/CDA1 family)